VLGEHQVVAVQYAGGHAALDLAAAAAGFRRVDEAAAVHLVVGDGAEARLGHPLDEVAVEVGPGRVAVQHHDRLPVARSLVDVVEAGPVGGREPARLVEPRAAEGPVRHRVALLRA
jgi:hypothetical protein